MSAREAARRLEVYGRNELERRGGHRLWRELGRQFTHPLALLLWAAAGLAWLGGIVQVAIAILIVIVLNALFAFAQEVQAERAVEALQDYLPQDARVLRDGTVCTVPAAELVPGDVMAIEEGERISADGRLLSGSVEIDASTLTGESMPVARSSDWTNSGVSLLQAHDLVFSGTTCTTGEATAVVVATGMHSELGRIAALSQRVEPEQSPLERQVRTVAWLIAMIAVVMAAAFMPIATLGGGLTLSAALVLAVGLIAGNVPEGLLPVITLALAIGVRDLAQRGAVVKRLSAAETLGSTDVICTDKTGTLTENHMRVTSLWTLAGELSLTAPLPGTPAVTGRPPAVDALLPVMVTCNNAHQDAAGQWIGDPTELAVLSAADAMGVRLTEEERTAQRVAQFHFDPARKLMSTLDRRDGTLQVDVKGAPEAILSRCTTVMTPQSGTVLLDDDSRRSVTDQVDAYAAAGLRVLAFAVRPVRDGDGVPSDRDEAERDLTLVGLAAMLDPPRPEVADAVARCHSAGIRIIVVTGDHPLTAKAIASIVGIGDHRTPVVTGEELDRMSDRQLDELLGGGVEVIFARTSPEAKLRISRCPARRGPHRGHDRRRGQRRPGAAPRRHRGGHGPGGHRRRARGVHHGADRRQLRHHRRCRARGPARLRQHPQVHRLYLRPLHAGDRPLPRLCAGSGPRAAASDCAAAPRLRRRHRDAACARTRTASRPSLTSWRVLRGGEAKGSSAYRCSCGPGSSSASSLPHSRWELSSTSLRALAGTPGIRSAPDARSTMRISRPPP